MANRDKRELFGFLCIYNKRHPLYTGHNFVGRNRKAHVVLRDISASRNHALLTVLDNRIFISDLRSRCHTYIEHNVIKPFQLYEIEDQCVLMFGTVKATLTINNTNQAETQEALVESQIDDSVFRDETQLQYENSFESASMSLQKTRNSSSAVKEDHLTNRFAVTKGKKSQGLTQIFWETRKSFQPDGTQQTESLAVISNSDSSSDDDIVKVLPTQDLDYVFNDFRKKESSSLKHKKSNSKVQENDVSKSEFHYSDKQTTNEVDTNVESIIQKQNLSVENIQIDNSQPSQPIRVKRKSLKQVLLSDSDTDLEDNDEVNLKVRVQHIIKGVLSDNKSSTITNSPNSIHSLLKENLEDRVENFFGEDSGSQVFGLKTKATEQVQNTEVELEVTAKHLSEKITSVSEAHSVNNEIEIEDTLNEEVEVTIIQNPNIPVQLSDANKENNESDVDTDLDDDDADNNKPNQECSQVMRVKRKSSDRVIKSDSDTDLDDDISNSKKCKASSSIKITETSTYSLDSDISYSMVFDLNNTDTKLAVDTKELPESKVEEEPLIGKSNAQDDTKDIIVSSDEDETETLGSKQNLRHESKYKCLRPSIEPGTKRAKDIFGLDESLSIDASINDSPDIKDTTQYIISTRKTIMFNETCNRNDDDDVSFIPATQDVAENVEVSTVETQKMDSEEKICQTNFSLGISEYINLSQDETKFAKSKRSKEIGKVTKEDNQKTKCQEATIVTTADVDEFGEDPELFLAPTQPLARQSNNDIPLAVVDDDIDDIFFAPTQLINENNDSANNETGVNSIFKPTHDLRSDGLAISDNERDDDNSLFLAPTQQSNPRNKDDSYDDSYEDDENSIFAQATQKVHTNEHEILEKQIDESDHLASFIKNQKLEQTNDTTRFSASKSVLSEGKCSNDTAKCLQIPQNASIRNEEKIKIDLEEMPGPSTSFKFIKVKRLSSLLNRSDDRGKSSRKSCKAATTDQVQNISDMAIFDQPTQITEHNPSDIFDVPTQIVDQPKKVQVNNTSSALLEKATEELIPVTDTLLICGNLDVFDMPTQIITNDVDTKASEHVNERNKDDDIAENGRNHVEISEDNAVTKQKEVDISISIANELIIESDVSDHPTLQQVHQERETNLDLYDMPTQIVSNDVETKVSGDAKKRSTEKIDVQIVNERNKDNNITEKERDYIEISKDNAVTKQQEVDISISIANELIIESDVSDHPTLQQVHQERETTNLDLYDMPTQITSSNVETKILKHKLKSNCSEMELQTATGVSKDDKDFEDRLSNIELINDNISSISKQQGDEVAILNEKEQLEKSLLNEVTATPRVTLRKIKETSAKNSRKKLQKGSKKCSTKSKRDVNKVDEPKVVEVDVDEIKLSILNTKDKVIDADKIVNENVDKPVFCTQDVLQVLTSVAEPINEMPVQNTLLYSTQDVLDVLTSGSTSMDKDQTNDTVKHIDVEVPKGKSATEHKMKDDPENKIQLKVDHVATPEDLDVLTSGTSVSENRDTSKSPFIKPKKVPRVKSTAVKLSKRTAQDRKTKDLQVLNDNKKEMSPVQENIDLVVQSIPDMKEDGSKTLLTKPKVANVDINVKARRGMKGQHEKDDRNVKMGLYSTQEVLDVLTKDDVGENIEVPRKHTIEENDSLSESVFMKEKEEHSETALQKPEEVVKPIITKTRRGTKLKHEKVKMELYSTQEGIDVLTKDDVEENIQVPLEHTIQEDDSLSESVFMKDTKQLNANLQSTMVNANVNEDDNHSDNDFEEIRKKIDVPSCSKNENTRKRANPPAKSLPKSKKRVTIKDLDEMHEVPITTLATTVEKPVVKKCKFPQIIEEHDDDDNDSESTNNSVIPSKMGRKIDTTKSESKTISVKAKQIVGILRKAPIKRSARSTNEPLTVLKNDTVEPIVKKSRLRKAQNNNAERVEESTNNTEMTTNVASCSTDNSSSKPTSQAKKGRPKKNVEVVPKDTVEIPTAKIGNGNTESTILGKRGWQKKNADADAVLNDTAGLPAAKRTAGRKESAASSRSDTIAETSILTPLSQRTKRLLKPKVVFTMLNSPELETVIRSLGGSVVDSVEACTVLVTASVKRSEKLLTAIGQRKPICSDRWLKDCKSQNKFLDPWSHIIRDKEAETKWDFSLEVSLERSQDKKLFQNYTMMLIVNTAQDILKKAIESAGGKCVTTARTIPNNFVIISVAENKKKFQKYVSGNSDVIVIEPEGIFDAVLRQEIRFDMFKLA